MLVLKKLQKLVKSSSIKDDELLKLLDEIEKNCEICIKYKKPSLKPAVGFSLSKEFNDVISMDLKYINGVTFLHIIDNATRFSAAAVVNSKRQEEIVDKFIKHWIAIFGAPCMIIPDNGGEFNNNLFTNMAEMFNIRVKPTPAESPWSNGIVERHNAILAKTIEKLMLEHKNKFPIDVIIAWAVNAKNSLHNCYGYSPNQLVFGHNPSLPSILANELPAFEDSPSELLKRHLNAIAESRKAFIECEANEKLRRAIRSKLRPTTSLIYETGDEVYYKRNDSNQWKGPGTVIGKENKQVIVKHGSQHIRVHPCRLQLRNKHQNMDNIDDETVNSCSNDLIVSNDKNDADENEDIVFKNTLNENINELNNSISNDDINQLTSSISTLSLNAEEIDSDRDTMHNVQRNYNNPTKTSGILPKTNTKVIYHNPDTDSWNKALVIGRAGKSTGKNKTWVNVKNLQDNSHQSVDFSKIEGWKNIEEEVLISKYSDINIDIIKAKSIELENWKTHNVYEVVENTGQSFVSLRWVIHEKFKGQDMYYKARLVARGFKESNFDMRKDSPTCCKENFRLLLAIVRTNKWKIHSLDIKAAFLQGKKIDRDLYVKPPPEAGTKNLWKLNISVYGLCDAPRAWYLSLKSVLEKGGARKSKYDDAIFYLYDNNKLQGILCAHVDDFCWGGTEQFELKIIKSIKQCFKISTEELQTFKYLGINVRQTDSCIEIDQNSYINELKEVEISHEKRKNKYAQLNKEEARQLRGLAGQLNWMASQTRPDMAYNACEISVSIKDATINDLIQANKYIRKAKSKNVSLKIVDLENLEQCSIICFSDASFANLKGNASQGGFIIFLYRNENLFSPIAWKSLKIKRVVKSTLAAETLALEQALEMCFMMKSLLCELLNKEMSNKVLPIKCYVDNKSLVDSIFSTKTVTEKRLKIDICIIRGMLSKNEVYSIEWCKSESQLADCLTKGTVNNAKLLNALKNGNGLLE